MDVYRPDDMTFRITHVITSLRGDGAQRTLARIARSLGRRAANMRVISLTELGPVAKDLEVLGVPVTSLELNPGRPSLRAPWALARLLKRDRTDLVVTWLYHADLLGTAAARIAGKLPVIWNVRHDDVLGPSSKRTTRIVAKLCAKLAYRHPRAVVFCSNRSRQSHVARGYPAERSIVIPNGLDPTQFHPMPEEASSLRRELGLSAAATLIGHFGRFHPDKDHRTLLAAAARIVAARPNVRFVLCGSGVDAANEQLMALLRRFDLTQHCSLLGHQVNVQRRMAAMDLIVSSSRTEAFPNTVAEALACGVPCVATDVGDTRDIIGPGGTVVPPCRSDYLADACLAELACPWEKRRQRGEKGRKHVVRQYNLAASSNRHFDVWQAASVAAWGAPAHRRLRRAA